jgi:hypothetical protein
MRGPFLCLYCGHNAYNKVMLVQHYRRVHLDDRDRPRVS